MVTTPALRVSDLVKVFPGRTMPAVAGVSFDVALGESIGLLGPNGAGKTTLIKCILGLISATSGKTLVFGYDTRRDLAKVLRHASAMLEGSRNTYWRLTAWENLAFFASQNGYSPYETANRSYLNEIVKAFGLERFRDTAVRELSSGYKQKVAVAASLARRTPLVFLDEPTLGLDVETGLELRHNLRRLVTEEGRTLLLSSHDMHVVEAVCERVMIMSQGRLLLDESVSSLLDLFRTRRYRLLVYDLTDECAAKLSRLGSVLEMKPEAGGVRMEVHLSRGEDLYVMMDLLRESGAYVEAITQMDPNLQQAFLELLKRERKTS